MAMTDKELDAWIDNVVNEAVDAEMEDAIAYMESGDLDRDVEADFADAEAEVAELEAKGLDEVEEDDEEQ